MLVIEKSGIYSYDFFLLMWMRMILIYFELFREQYDKLPTDLGISRNNGEKEYGTKKKELRCI